MPSHNVEELYHQFMQDPEYIGKEELALAEAKHRVIQSMNNHKALSMAKMDSPVESLLEFLLLQKGDNDYIQASKHADKDAEGKSPYTHIVSHEVREPSHEEILQHFKDELIEMAHQDVKDADDPWQAILNDPTAAFAESDNITNEHNFLTESSFGVGGIEQDANPDNPDALRRTIPKGHDAIEELVRRATPSSNAQDLIQQFKSAVEGFNETQRGNRQNETQGLGPDGNLVRNPRLDQSGSKVFDDVDPNEGGKTIHEILSGTPGLFAPKIHEGTQEKFVTHNPDVSAGETQYDSTKWLQAFTDVMDSGADWKSPLHSNWGGRQLKQGILPGATQLSVEDLHRANEQGRVIDLVQSLTGKTHTSPKDALERLQDIRDNPEQFLRINPETGKAALRTIQEGTVKHYLPDTTDDLDASDRESYEERRGGDLGDIVSLIGDMENQRDEFTSPPEMEDESGQGWKHEQPLSPLQQYQIHNAQHPTLSSEKTRLPRSEPPVDRYAPLPDPEIPYRDANEKLPVFPAQFAGSGNLKDDSEGTSSVSPAGEDLMNKVQQQYNRAEHGTPEALTGLFNKIIGENGFSFPPTPDDVNEREGNFPKGEYPTREISGEESQARRFYDKNDEATIRAHHQEEMSQGQYNRIELKDEREAGDVQTPTPEEIIAKLTANPPQISDEEAKAVFSRMTQPELDDYYTTALAYSNRAGGSDSATDNLSGMSEDSNTLMDDKKPKTARLGDDDKGFDAGPDAETAAEEANKAQEFNSELVGLNPNWKEGDNRNARFTFITPEEVDKASKAGSVGGVKIAPTPPLQSDITEAQKEKRRELGQPIPQAASETDDSVTSASPQEGFGGTGSAMLGEEGGTISSPTRAGHVDVGGSFVLLNKDTVEDYKTYKDFTEELVKYGVPLESITNELKNGQLVWSKESMLEGMKQHGMLHHGEDDAPRRFATGVGKGYVYNQGVAPIFPEGGPKATGSRFENLKAGMSEEQQQSETLQRNNLIKAWTEIHAGTGRKKGRTEETPNRARKADSTETFRQPLNSKPTQGDRDPSQRFTRPEYLSENEQVNVDENGKEIEQSVNAPTFKRTGGSGNFSDGRYLNHLIRDAVSKEPKRGIPGDEAQLRIDRENDMRDAFNQHFAGRENLDYGDIAHYFADSLGIQVPHPKDMPMGKNLSPSESEENKYHLHDLHKDTPRYDVNPPVPMEQRPQQNIGSPSPSVDALQDLLQRRGSETPAPTAAEIQEAVEPIKSEIAESPETPEHTGQLQQFLAHVENVIQDTPSNEPISADALSELDRHIADSPLVGEIIPQRAIEGDVQQPQEGRVVEGTSRLINGESDAEGEQPPAEAPAAEQPQFVNHSGGAPGADSVWGEVGNIYGVESRHYYEEGNKTSKGNTPISQEESDEAIPHLQEASKTMGRRLNLNADYAHLLKRNWQQVKGGDEVFAVATIGKGSRGFQGTPNVVDGGTGWAVHMAINNGKPVHVFDEQDGKWHTWQDGQFVEEDTPTLTPNFAGIGSRKMGVEGQKAIRDIYKNTMKVTGRTHLAAEEAPAAESPAGAVNFNDDESDVQPGDENLDDDTFEASPIEEADGNHEAATGQGWGGSDVEENHFDEESGEQKGSQGYPHEVQEYARQAEKTTGLNLVVPGDNAGQPHNDVYNHFGYEGGHMGGNPIDLQHIKDYIESQGKTAPKADWEKDEEQPAEEEAKPEETTGGTTPPTTPTPPTAEAAEEPENGDSDEEEDEAELSAREQKEAEQEFAKQREIIHTAHSTLDSGKGLTDNQIKEYHEAINYMHKAVSLFDKDWKATTAEGFIESFKNYAGRPLGEDSQKKEDEPEETTEEPQGGASATANEDTSTDKDGGEEASPTSAHPAAVEVPQDIDEAKGSYQKRVEGLQEMLSAKPEDPRWFDGTFGKEMDDVMPHKGNIPARLDIYESGWNKGKPRLGERSKGGQPRMKYGEGKAEIPFQGVGKEFTYPDGKPGSSGGGKFSMAPGRDPDKGQKSMTVEASQANHMARGEHRNSILREAINKLSSHSQALHDDEEGSAKLVDPATGEIMTPHTSDGQDMLYQHRSDYREGNKTADSDDLYKPASQQDQDTSDDDTSDDDTSGEDTSGQEQQDQDTSEADQEQVGGEETEAKYVPTREQAKQIKIIQKLMDTKQAQLHQDNIKRSDAREKLIGIADRLNAKEENNEEITESDRREHGLAQQAKAKLDSRVQAHQNKINEYQQKIDGHNKPPTSPQATESISDLKSEKFTDEDHPGNPKNWPPVGNPQGGHEKLLKALEHAVSEEGGSLPENKIHEALSTDYGRKRILRQYEKYQSDNLFGKLDQKRIISQKPKDLDSVLAERVKNNSGAEITKREATEQLRKVIGQSHQLAKAAGIKPSDYEDWVTNGEHKDHLTELTGLVDNALKHGADRNRIESELDAHGHDFGNPEHLEEAKDYHDAIDAHTDNFNSLFKHETEHAEGESFHDLHAVNAWSDPHYHPNARIEAKDLSTVHRDKWNPEATNVRDLTRGKTETESTHVGHDGEFRNSKGDFKFSLVSGEEKDSVPHRQNEVSEKSFVDSEPPRILGLTPEQQEMYTQYHKNTSSKRFDFSDEKPKTNDYTSDKKALESSLVSTGHMTEGGESPLDHPLVGASFSEQHDNALTPEGAIPKGHHFVPGVGNVNTKDVKTIQNNLKPGEAFHHTPSDEKSVNSLVSDSKGTPISGRSVMITKDGVHNVGDASQKDFTHATDGPITKQKVRETDLARGLHIASGKGASEIHPNVTLHNDGSHIKDVSETLGKSGSYFPTNKSLQIQPKSPSKIGQAGKTALQRLGEGYGKSPLKRGLDTIAQTHTEVNDHFTPAAVKQQTFGKVVKRGGASMLGKIPGVGGALSSAITGMSPSQAAAETAAGKVEPPLEKLLKFIK